MRYKLSKTDIQQIFNELPLNDFHRSIFEVLLLNGNQSPSKILSLLQASIAVDTVPSRGTFYAALSALIDAGVINKTGSAPNVAYFVDEAFVADRYLSIDYLKRSEKEFNLSFFMDYQPNISRVLPIELSIELRKISDATIKQGDTINNIVFSNLLVDFSFSSSKMEGNTYSILDTKKLLETGEKAEGKTEKESQMILNHASAMRYLIDNAKEVSLEPFEIRAIHAILSKNLLNTKDQEGGIRQGIVFIGGTSYQPLSGELILSEQLKLFCDKASCIEDPYECSMFILAGISYLQAFNDVNKRTARLLTNLPLLKNNLCPISFFDADNDRYVKSLIAFYEINNTTLLSDFFVSAYKQSALRYRHYFSVINHNKQRSDVIGFAEKMVGNYLLHIVSGGIYSGNPRSFFDKSFTDARHELSDSVLIVFLSRIKDILREDFFSIMKKYELTAKQVSSVLSSIGNNDIDVDIAIARSPIDAITQLDVEIKQQIYDLYQKKNKIDLSVSEQSEYDQACELSNKIESQLAKMTQKASSQ